MSIPAVQHEHDNSGPHWRGEDDEKWLHKDGDTITISAKAMRITWGGDERFWRWIRTDESRFGELFGEAAELVQVSWMEVRGVLDTAKYPLSPSKTYEIVYVIKFNRDAFGWDGTPVTFHLVTPDGHSKKRSQSLETRSGEWRLVHGGEFTTSPPDGMTKKLLFCMAEVELDIWKGGMILGGVIVRPKSAA